MRQTIFTLLILCAIGFMSCRKNTIEPTFKQYDQNQIDAYIKANGLTGMQRDTSGGDTTGIYYQVLSTGKGAKVDYSDSVSFVYTIRSFDNQFIAPDTIANHYSGYLGRATPNGLMLALHNIVKTKGTRVRVLIPSHLAYGLAGVGSGSKTITTGRIAGNQCLDYYVNLVDDQNAYDDLVIRNYMTTNNLTGYTKTASGLYYKITKPGTGLSPITYNSSVVVTYDGHLLNGTDFSSFLTATGTSFDMPAVIPGVSEGLEQTTAGGNISLLIPSKLAYKGAGVTGVPAYACLRFEYSVLSVTP